MKNVTKVLSLLFCSVVATSVQATKISPQAFDAIINCDEPLKIPNNFTPESQVADATKIFVMVKDILAKNIAHMTPYVILDTRNACNQLSKAITFITCAQLATHDEQLQEEAQELLTKIQALLKAVVETVNLDERYIVLNAGDHKNILFKAIKGALK